MAPADDTAGAKEETAPPPETTVSFRETPDLENDGMSNEEGGGAVKPRMSAVTAKYDLTGKGYLDETEKVLRELDSSNRGYLNLNKVYQVVKEMQEQQLEYQKEQKKSSNLKKTVFALAAFAVVLALANMGTAFAAAKLAKDTTTDAATSDLLSKDTGKRVGTTSKTDLFHATTAGGGQSGRLLNPDEPEDTTGSANSGNLEILKVHAETMWNTCVGKEGATGDHDALVDVAITYDCADASENYVLKLACSSIKTTGKKDTYKYLTTMGAMGATVEIECNDDSDSCGITGTSCGGGCCSVADCVGNPNGPVCNDQGNCIPTSFAEIPDGSQLGCSGPEEESAPTCGGNIPDCECCSDSDCTQGNKRNCSGGVCRSNQEIESGRLAACCTFATYNSVTCGNQ